MDKGGLLGDRHTAEVGGQRQARAELKAEQREERMGCCSHCMQA